MKMNKSAASSQPAKLVRKSASDIRRYAKSDEAKLASARLRSFGDGPTAADLEEIPELTDEELSRMRPAVKRPVTVRIDPDILQWLKSKGGPYQTRLNATLRKVMEHERGR